MLTEKAMAAVEHQVAASLGTPANVRTVVDSGTPHAGVLTQADATSAGLIVMAPGRTAVRVGRHATVPTMIARHSHRGIVIGANGLFGSLFAGVGIGGSGSSATWVTTPASSRRRRWHIRPRWCGWCGRSGAAVRARHSGHFDPGNRRSAGCGSGQASRGVDPLRYRWRRDCEVGTGGADHRRPRSVGVRRTRRRRYSRSHRPSAVDARQHRRSSHAVGPMLCPRGPAGCASGGRSVKLTPPVSLAHATIDTNARCPVIVMAHDASGDTGQNGDPGIFTGNLEFWPVSSELDGIRFGLANRRLPSARFRERQHEAAKSRSGRADLAGSSASMRAKCGRR